MASRPKQKDVRGKKPGTPTKKTSSEYVDPSTWQERYNKAQHNQQELFNRFSKWFDLMYAVVDTKNFAPWRSKVFVPLLASKAWAMISKFVTIKPGWEVVVRDKYDEAQAEELIAESRNAEVDFTDEEEEKIRKEAEEAKQRRADKAQKKLEYDFDNPDLDDPIRDKLVACLVDTVVTGQSVAKVPWHFKKIERREHKVNADGEFDYTQDVVYEKSYGCNDLVPINIFNFFISPSATSLQGAPWVIIREFKTLAELKSTNEANGGNFYKNLRKISETATVSDEYAQYNRARNRLTLEEDKIAADQTVSMVEVFECYDKATGSISTYANTPVEGKPGETAWLPLREAKNIYWHGKYPLVSFYVKKRPHDFWGEGIFEASHRLQAAANDLFNHYLDNWNLSIDGMLMADTTSNISEFNLEPGGLITYSGQKPDQFKFPEPNPAQLSVVMTEIQRAIEENTISGYAQGIPSSRLDKTQGTATGVMRIQEAANDVIAFMKGNFDQALLQIGRFFLSNNQQFMDREMTMSLMRKNKLQMETIKPVDLHGDLDVYLDNSSTQPMSKAERRDTFLAFTAQALQIQAASIKQAQLVPGSKVVKLDFDKYLEDLARHFGQRNIDHYVLTEGELEQTPTMPGAEATEGLGNLPTSEADIMKSMQGFKGAQGGMYGMEGISGQAG